MNFCSKFSRMTAFVVSLFFFAVIASPLLAQSINFQTLAQNQFEKTARDLGTAFSYIPADPAEAHGIIGFNLGLAATAVQLPQDNQYMKDTFKNSDVPGTLLLPKIQLEKGLPFVEVGGFVAGNPDGDARVLGGQVKYMILEGTMATPALALRGHGTQLTGVDDLALNTYGADLSISKGFEVPFLAGITPFAGYSMFKINAEEKAGLRLDEATMTENRMFAGARISVLFFNVVAEVDVGQEVKMYTLRTNFGF